MTDKSQTTEPEPFHRSSKMIHDAIEEAIFDAFDMEPPEDNSRPIRSAGKAHQCPDWDFLFIRPGDPEMECCTCPK